MNFVLKFCGCILGKGFENVQGKDLILRDIYLPLIRPYMPYYALICPNIMVLCPQRVEILEMSDELLLVRLEVQGGHKV